MRVLGRGAVAGAAGGVLAGVFGFVVAAPTMDAAVRAAAARGLTGSVTQDGTGWVAPGGAGVFDRHSQHPGLLLRWLVAGVVLGVLFAVLLEAFSSGRQGGAVQPEAGAGCAERGCRQALGLGAAGWFAVCAVPFMRYPAEPPSADPDAFDVRPALYLAVIVIGALGVALAAGVTAGLRRHAVRRGVRNLAVAGVLLLTVALSFMMPDDPDRFDTVPAGLLWRFWLLSFVTSSLLWAGTVLTIGVLVRGRAGPAAPPGGRTAVTA